jgi:MSHA biogenesis protein MshI
MNFFRKSPRPGWLCLTMHDDRVDLSHVLAEGRPRPEVLLCESFRKDGDDVATLVRLRRELDLDRYRCLTVLKHRDYQMFSIDRPEVPDSEVRAAARWSLKDLIDYPIETVTVDAVGVPAGDGERKPQMLAIAVRNETISAMVKPFNEADIGLIAIDVPEFAQRNLAHLLEAEGRGLALFGVDADSATLTFTADGELYQSRRIEVSLGDFENEAAAESLYDRVALELQRSFDHFDRKFRNVSLSRVVVCNVPFGDQFVGYLAANLTLPVELLDLGQVMDFPSVPELRDPLRQTQCLQIIGASMRAGSAA